MRFLLDSDHISALQWQSGPDWLRLSHHLAQHAADDLAFSIVSFHEQVLGCHTYLAKARSAHSLIRGYDLLTRALDAFRVAQVLAFDSSAVAIFTDLQTRRLRVASMDLRIAAIALSNNLILVTRNIADFGRIPNLICVNWMA